MKKAKKKVLSCHREAKNQEPLTERGPGRALVTAEYYPRERLSLGELTPTREGFTRGDERRAGGAPLRFETRARASQRLRDALFGVCV